MYCELPDGSSGFWIEDNNDRGMIEREVERRARLVGPWQVVWTVLERKHQEHIKKRRIGLADNKGRLVACAYKLESGTHIISNGQELIATPLSHFQRDIPAVEWRKRVEALPVITEYNIVERKTERADIYFARA